MDVYAADWVLPVEGEPIPEGAVAVEGGRIVAVGPAEEVAGAAELERFPESAIIPGLVNAHSHLEYAVYAGFGDGLSFGPWIALHMERKARIDFDDMVTIARLGAAECLASGITTVADASFSGAAAPACAELGLRATVCLEVFGADPEGAVGRFEETRARIEASLSERVRLGVSPHAPYTVSADVYRALGELGLPVATHLAESADEHDFMVQGGGPIAGITRVTSPGLTSVRHLAANGLLGSHLVAAHCVRVDAEEIALLAEHDVAVAHCPRSNAVLGCGTAPVADLIAAGIRVGIGTDSPASAPSFDAFEELRAAVYAARARAGRPDALAASEALRLATLGSARALGLDDQVGSLAPGKRADLTVVSLAGSPYLPWEDPAVAVVFGGSPERVELTLVDGERRYERGGFGWLELRRAAARARERLLGRAPSRARSPRAPSAPRA